MWDTPTMETQPQPRFLKTDKRSRITMGRELDPEQLYLVTVNPDGSVTLRKICPGALIDGRPI